MNMREGTLLSILRGPILLFTSLSKLLPQFGTDRVSCIPSWSGTPCAVDGDPEFQNPFCIYLSAGITGAPLLSPTRGFVVVIFCLTGTTQEFFGAFTRTATEDAVPELSTLPSDFSYSQQLTWLACGCLSHTSDKRPGATSH